LKGTWGLFDSGGDEELDSAWPERQLWVAAHDGDG
jgi:hypothetical protein